MGMRQLGKLADLIGRNPAKRAIRGVATSINDSDMAKQVGSVLKEIYATNGGDAALTAANIIRYLTGSRGVMPEQLVCTAEVMKHPEVLEALTKLETGSYINDTAKTALNLSELVKRNPEYLAGALGLISDCHNAYVASSISEGVLNSIVKVGVKFPQREMAFAQMLLWVRRDGARDFNDGIEASSVGSNMANMMEKFGDRNFEKILTLTEQYPSEVSARLAEMLYDYVGSELYLHDGYMRDSSKPKKLRKVSLEEALDETIGLMAKPEVGSLFGKMNGEAAPFAMLSLVKIASLGDDAVNAAVGTAQQYHRNLSRYVLETLAESPDAVRLAEKARAMRLQEIVGFSNANSDWWEQVLIIGGLAELGEEAAREAVRLTTAYGLGNVLRTFLNAKSEKQVLNAASVMAAREVKSTIEYFGGDSAAVVLSALLRAGDNSTMRKIAENITVQEVQAVLEPYSSDERVRVRTAEEALNFVIGSKSVEEIKELAEIMALPEAVEVAHNGAGMSYNAMSPLLDVLRNVGADTAKRFARTVSRFKGHSDTTTVAYGLRNVAGDQETFTAACDSIDRIGEKGDQLTALFIGRSAARAAHIMGDKYRSFLSYMERRGGRNDVLTVERASPDVREAVARIKTPTSSNTQMHNLIRFVRYTDANYTLRVTQQASEDLQAALRNAEAALRQHLEQFGIREVEEALQFLPWLQTKDETALKALRGEQVQKSGQNRSYVLRTAQLDAEALAQEVRQYARIAGVILPELALSKPSIDSVKQAAQYVISEIDKIDRKKDISRQALKEAKPNLDRILQTTNNEGEYTLHVAPQDIKGQMEALQTIPSCLSPGSMYFRHTQNYMANPNTFFATIKGKQGAVGRVTVFTGTIEDDKPAIARVSKLYAIVPVREGDVDEALRKYALETGMVFLERGILKVDGLREAYDDRISFDGKHVTIR